MSAPPIRRVLVAVDASEPSGAAAEMAAEVAALLEVALAGLFVEDLKLLELAGRPLVRRYDPLSAASLSLERPVLERTLRAQAERARRQLAAAAGRAGAAWSFRSVRGAVEREILAAARPGDLVVVGRVGWARGSGAGLGRTVHALLHDSPEALLVLPPKPVPIGAVTVLCEEVEGSLALALAAALVAGRRWPLRVLLPSGPPTPAAAEERVTRELRARGLEAEVRQLPRAALSRELARSGGAHGLLVLRRDAIATPGELHALLEGCAGPVLLIA
ncbi:MAG: universal stress protein [Acidobacteria bacterium]|nr:universal stress protein [Thermoanaerobaculia bacterium]NLN11142.1 universal stress protein [Acidobacteriota bacterium]MBP7813410.1 universal stress protein [Thermoanaerobaculia bacterium]MBP8844855.1 universal stress protein [Thermoanaerobaculia bacterium]HPA96257.1 universal stress protein [Thermoanaerobaculia bacterium]